ncbi:MAG: hypothetical protein HQ478_05120 [Chloroflexi bacterium]|nr:hypothetical protein [Chloroflexota bacterium]
MIEIEKAGIPAIPIVSGRFNDDAIASSRAFGMPDLQWVVVPRIYRNLEPELSESQTAEVIDEIIANLTSSGSARDSALDHESTRRYEGDDTFDAVLKMNEDFLRDDLGDGLLLHPPTDEAVAALIAGTCLDANFEVCDMPPGFGIATVEKIAINAAMAGAKPEHMPVIIASVKALSMIGGGGGKSLLMSTSPQAPLLIVNGPVTKELGFNPRSAIGPGRDNHVNTIVGRAFALCFRNIGYWYPGKMDMDTIGTTRKFIQCLAENEDMSPWPSFAHDRGFKPEESTVSLFITDGELDVQDQGNHTAEGLMKTLAYGCTFGTRSIQGKGGGVQRLILMPPDVAGPIGKEGFSKQEAKEFITKHAVGSLGKMIRYMPLEGEARVSEHWEWLRSLTEEQLLDVQIAVMDSPDDCSIVVLGADRAKTAVFPSGPSPVTVGVDEYRPG